MSNPAFAGIYSVTVSVFDGATSLALAGAAACALGCLCMVSVESLPVAIVKAAVDDAGDRDGGGGGGDDDNDDAVIEDPRKI